MSVPNRRNITIANIVHGVLHPFSTCVWSVNITTNTLCQSLTELRKSFVSLILTNRLLEQGYVATRLKSSLQKIYARHHELVDRCGASICATDLLKTDLFNVS